MGIEQYSFLKEEWEDTPDVTDIEYLYDVKLIGVSLEWYYYLWEMDGSFYLIRIDIESARKRDPQTKAETEEY